MFDGGKMFDKLAFQGKWRSYQALVLEELNTHLSDGKLHVVAAPGAGKTILGLEVIKRLGRPCIVLAPTNTIKNQWALRLKQMFMEDKSIAGDVISHDIFNPKLLTVCTYQGLLAGFCGRHVQEDEELQSEEENTQQSKAMDRFDPQKAKNLINVFKKNHIGTLCLDEAHHLRNEWWKALDYLVDELKPKTILSLTATPPYDVDMNEWNRYESLCGPVDEAICIPELVKNKDLCPHQDLIYFAKLRPTEKAAWVNYEKQTGDFIKDFLCDIDFAKAIYQLDLWYNPQKYSQYFYEDPDFFIAMASLLTYHKFEIPPAFLKLFDTKQEKIPLINKHLIDVLLNGFIFKHRADYSFLEEFIEKYNKKASSAGLIEQKNVGLSNNRKIVKLMARSLSKLDAITDIVKKEAHELQHELRMVILADYIKYDSFMSGAEVLGVVPIFQQINQLKLSYVSLGILSGKIILIPKSIKQDFDTLINEAGISKADFVVSGFKYAPDYIQIKPKEKTKNKIVHLITEMFNEGALTVLVGTQALLGEGWDAPSINSLVLSSTVASYMLSNQMRGRAIRIDKQHPNKISFIWHLANVRIPNYWDILTGQKPEVEGDFKQIQQRFDGFEAPSLLPPYDITNGLERCLFGEKIEKMSENDFTAMTKNMLSYSRQEVKKSWDAGFLHGTGMGTARLKSGLDTSVRMKRFILTDYYLIKLATGLTVGTCLSQGILNSNAGNITGALQYLSLIWGSFIAYMVPSTLRFLRAGNPKGMLKQISMTILETLFQTGYIETNPKASSLNIITSDATNYVVCADRLNQKENSIFINALKEFMEPIDNPRYLLIRRNIFGFIFKQNDYHAIPSLIGLNKKNVLIFKKIWRKRIGKCNIIYTRTKIGHEFLLKARMKAYSTMDKEMTKKVSIWH